MYLKVTAVKPINTLREESSHGVGSHCRRKGDSSFPHTAVLMVKKGRGIVLNADCQLLLQEAPKFSEGPF